MERSNFKTDKKAQGNKRKTHGKRVLKVTKRGHAARFQELKVGQRTILEKRKFQGERRHKQGEEEEEYLGRQGQSPRGG